MKQEIKIAAFGSHSALQILKGAKDEGFKTICICLKGRDYPYRSYRVADELMIIDRYEDYFKVEEELIKKNAVLIPHASMISYLGAGNIKKINLNYFGDKDILEIESDRHRQESWLKAAGLRLPKIFDNPHEIDRPCIVKSHGAAGGQGYFLVKNEKDFRSKAMNMKEYVVQEYIIGVPVYIHYFYSPLTDELEVMGFDRRYESNVDAIGRISAMDQTDIEIPVTYTVIGNYPIVVRESLLPEIFDMGRKVVEQSKKLTKKGLIGAFCLETVITSEAKIIVFEISARIVAGTNVHVGGSPYTYLRYNEPMSTGRRIAREIKEAINRDELNLVLS
jgi:5-formaminoimidazole-4-carboxamide-1-(beta)-D-ribofuranosyl 5'-monophosphate synthetase